MNSLNKVINTTQRLINLPHNKSDNRIIIKKSKTNTDKPGWLYLMQCIYCKQFFKLMGKLYNKGLGKYCSYYCASKNRIFTIETLEKMRQSHKGNKIRLGCKMSEESKAKISKYQTGKHPTEETRKKLSEWQLGSNNPNWKGGITELAQLIRGLSKNDTFRLKVFERDNYTCQECNIRGKYLEVHHVKPFNILLLDFLQNYNQFSPIDDKEKLIRLAISWFPFWNINNGKTLCSDCHNKTKKGKIR
jgi:hypothetical protein